MAIDLNTTEDAVQMIGFYIGRKLCGADVLAVKEILRNPVISTTENQPPFSEGVIELRGESIPLVDLKRRLGVSSAEEEAFGEWVLIVAVGERKAAYAVDSVTRILKLSKGDILPAPDIILSGLRNQYIRGVYNSDNGLLIVLDLHRMLSADEIKTLEKWNPHP